MFTNLIPKAAIAGALIMAAQTASAAVFDFVSIADGPDPNFIGAAELNWADTAFAAGLTIDGITLIASGSNGDMTAADAFFDKGTAGLGVCSTAGPGPGLSGCATGIGSDTSDDNVSGGHGGETLTLAFDMIVDLTDLFFRNAGHPPLTGSLAVNGGAVTVAAGVVTSGFSHLSGSSSYDFEWTGDEFYIASATAIAAVPVPAAGLMLLGALGGLGGFGAMRRRRKAS